jgi:histidyl-tRNA synthetase
MNKVQTLKGFRDFLPPKMMLRNHVKNILIDTFEIFAFLPLETPALEYASTLKGKSSQETDQKLAYFFKDNGDREIGLRYDLTVPVAKVLAIYSNQIQLPFKRYQIQPVWRAENTQKGRYREFIQCDIDTFGTNSPMAESEIISLVYQATKKLNISSPLIRINSRSVLSNILTQSNIEKDQNSVLQSLDKIDKIDEEGVKKELKVKGLNDNQINDLFKYIKTAQPDQQLQKILSQLKAFNLPESSYIFDPTLVRGCDYYTGPIFELTIKNSKASSLGGGGRYDQLIKNLGGPDIPAVGFSFGFERIIDYIKDNKLFTQQNQSRTKVLIANFGNETETNTIELSQKLRDQGISTLLYPDDTKLGKQIKYATSLEIPYLAIIGNDEAKNNTITLKNLKTTKQEVFTFEQLIKTLTK